MSVWNSPCTSVSSWFRTFVASDGRLYFNCHSTGSPNSQSPLGMYQILHQLLYQTLSLGDCHIVVTLPIVGVTLPIVRVTSSIKGWLYRLKGWLYRLKGWLSRSVTVEVLLGIWIVSVRSITFYTVSVRSYTMILLQQCWFNCSGWGMINQLRSIAVGIDARKFARADSILSKLKGQGRTKT
jgi:hypothetical protein